MNSRRRLLGLAVVPALLSAHDDEGDPGLNRVLAIHGSSGPFAVAGYRMGQAAMKQLGLGRASGDCEVIHHAPVDVELSSVVDGLQAATGASLGKRNLLLVDSAGGESHSVVRNRKTNRQVRLTLTAGFLKAHRGMAAAAAAAAGARLIAVPESEIFRGQ